MFDAIVARACLIVGIIASTPMRCQVEEMTSALFNGVIGGSKNIFAGAAASSFVTLPQLALLLGRGVESVNPQ